MTTQQTAIRGTKLILIVSALWLGVLVPGQAVAGGLLLYEVGTADVGLASAGWGARAQDASAILTNPAGMTRLEGSQALLGAQALYGDYGFSIGPGTSPGLGTGDGGNPIGWFPGGSAFFSYSASPDLKIGFGMAGNFGLSEKYDDNWVGRYYVQEATMLGLSLLPSVAYKVTNKLSLGMSVNAMWGKYKNQVAINIPDTLRPGGFVPIRRSETDAQLDLDDNTWGWGVNLGLLYEFTPRTRLGFTWNSQVNLDFSGPAEFSNLGQLGTTLQNAGLLNSNIDVGIRIPQQLMASLFHQVNPRWAVLGSVGWQQWSKFGEVQLGIDNTGNPTSLTKNLDFKDTWHFAAGAQYSLSDAWLLNFGVAYDSKFQGGSTVSPLLPVNDAWRFGTGVQNQVSKTFSWGVAAEYAYGGTLDVDKQSTLPVELGGRGNLVGSYPDTGIFFLAANFTWKF
jgi:long-chain fatty acid transport protein